MKLYFQINQFGNILILTESGERIGHVGYGLSSEYSNGRAIGYGINAVYRGRGIMPRAVKAFIEHSDHKVFQAVTLPDNEASKRVLLKCGFVHVNLNETIQDPDANWVFEYVKGEVSSVAS